MIPIEGAETIFKDLPLYFYDRAYDHFQLMLEVTKTLYRDDCSEQYCWWIEELVNHFKMSEIKVTEKYTQERYTLADVRNHRDPDHYTTKRFTYARALRHTGEATFITNLLSGLDSELRHDLGSSNNYTTYT